MSEKIYITCAYSPNPLTVQFTKRKNRIIQFLYQFGQLFKVKVFGSLYKPMENFGIRIMNQNIFDFETIKITHKFCNVQFYASQRICLLIFENYNVLKNHLFFYKVLKYN
ncbi:hypothetical protein BpHYR1_014579 [Brachionus plicatilis]|uniref:Uncharacterized protein n=1 Tax=Brachionus plicatilis TaxID=10195 RepID=A0A3M7RMW6_BRAPC|nr:hypothetical protein BpHYR1_014579 [Brachionus plicatilis]